MTLFNDTWVNMFTLTSSQWVADSLSSSRTDLLFIDNESILSFFFNPSFLKQNFSLDHLTKLSYLDTVLMYDNTQHSGSALYGGLYTAFGEDFMLQTSAFFLPFPSLLHSEYQDTFSIILLISPELSTTLGDYIYSYITPNSFMDIPSEVFDTYVSNWFYFIGLANTYYISFGVYVWVLVCAILFNIISRWCTPSSFWAVRPHYYVFSVSKELRMQLEALLQTVIFFTTYWVISLMVFDDGREDTIDLVDSSFFYLFALITLYLVFKYSVHYFSFLEASIVEGRSIGFLVKQVFRDSLNTLSLLLRFYMLLLRVNVYDTLDDFLDSYYIFVGDFDEDEYLSEVFLGVYGSLVFMSENDYDTSNTYGDDHGSYSDYFYVYFVVWGKLFYFIFFMLEEVARLGLAFYVCYLVIFEVHSVDCSYKEGKPLFNKQAVFTIVHAFIYWRRVN